MAWIVLAGTCVGLEGYSAAPGRTGDNINTDILHYVNLHRKQKGMLPLVMDEAIAAVARKHSEDMAKGRTPVGHKGFSSRMKQISRKIGPVGAMAENVAYGYTSGKAVVEGWLESPGHRENMEGNYRLTGIGVARDKDGKLYFTEIFVEK